MAYRLPVTCPLCNEDLDPEIELETHLFEDHTKRELAETVAVDFELSEDGFG